MPAPTRLAVSDKIIADFCCDHDLIALVRKCLRDQLFAQAISIGIGGIEERNSEIERLVHESDRLALRKLAPPSGRDRPEAEPDLADAQFSILVGAKTHRK